MKKKFLITLLMFVIVCAFAACGSNTPDDKKSDNKTQKVLTSSLLKDTKVDLTDVASLGISKEKPAASAATLSSGGVDSYALTTSAKNYFITIDDEDNIEEVVFIADDEDAESEDAEIRQDEIEGQINKLHVTKDFVFLMYSFTSQRDLTDADYDKKYYICDKQNQSFVIHRMSGKIYSLEALSNINFIYGNVLLSDDRYYTISFKNNVLNLTPLITNTTVVVHRIDVDIYGNVFIGNNSIKKTQNNIVFYIYDDNANSHCLGSDNKMYYLPYDNTTTFFQFKYYNENTALVIAPSDVDVFIGRNASNSFIIKNNTMYHIFTYVTLDVCFWNDASQGFDVGNLSFTICDVPYTFGVQYLGAEIFSMKYGANNTVDLFYINIDEIDWDTATNENILQFVMKLDTVESLAKEGDNLIVSKQEPNGTMKYIIYIEDGIAYYELYQTTSYSGSVISIQPLN